MEHDSTFPKQLDIYNGDSQVIQTHVQMVPSITIAGPDAICPDLLRINQLGDADGWRGHLVRSFFHVLKWVTGV